MRSAAWEAWVAKARSVRIEDECSRRGIVFNGQAGKTDRCGPCPKCGGEDRFAINTKKQVFNCRGCSARGDVIAFVQFLDNSDFAHAVKALTGEPPPKRTAKLTKGTAKLTKAVVAAEYRYHNADGALAFIVERVEHQNADGSFVIKDDKRKKTFRQKRPDPDRPGKFVWNTEGVPIIPYALLEVTAAIAGGRTIFIVEGEKCVDHLRELSVPATTNRGGAGKWRPELNAFFVGADVVLIPDNDDAGHKHVQEIGAALTGVASRIRVLVLPGLPPKGDITDWLTADGTREVLDRLVEQAPDWQPAAADKADEIEKAKAEADEQKIIEALAQLSPGITFARRRKEAAKQLGVSESAINAELEARRGEKVPAPLHGHWVVEPWPEPVEGDSLLRNIIRRIRRHIVCSDEDALTIALWIMFAWVHDEVAIHSPILNITSAEPESGKTTTVNLTSFLAPRCVASVEISEAALYRAIQLWQPSFAIDEFDLVLANPEKTALRSVINSGHTRGQGVVRCVEPDFTPQLFKTFCPKCIGMIGRKLPTTTLSRCIFVELRRRRKSESIERFAHKDDAELAQLRSRLARWAADSEEALCAANTVMPEKFDNRRADNWRVMLAIADLAGEDWGDKARLAASRLEGASDITSIGQRLLADIKRIFDEDGCEAILSAKLVERLKEDQEQPWAEWGRGKGLTQNSLAVLLGGGGGRGRGTRGGFGIHSDTVHPARDVQGKGYKRSQFKDAWERYLPPENPPSLADQGQ
jgi:uncharacterized protein DUF3631/CHC2-type zinc finger protein